MNSTLKHIELERRNTRKFLRRANRKISERRKEMNRRRKEIRKLIKSKKSRVLLENV